MLVNKEELLKKLDALKEKYSMPFDDIMIIATAMAVIEKAEEVEYE